MNFMVALARRCDPRAGTPCLLCSPGPRAPARCVLALVMIVVVGAIGIFVADRTVTATGTPVNDNLSAMQTALLSSGQTGSSFIVILVIAFIGGIAISYMFGLMGRRRS